MLDMEPVHHRDSEVKSHEVWVGLLLSTAFTSTASEVSDDTEKLYTAV
jgi:hypothetical protein